jgi:hypothetical protein
VHPLSLELTQGIAAPTPSSKDAKAKGAKKAALKGTHGKAARKVRTTVSFHRPKTLRLPRTVSSFCLVKSEDVDKSVVASLPP